MIEDSKYCIEEMNKHFNKELVMTKEDKEDFKNSIRCWIYHNNYIANNIKVRDHSHITGKYRGSAHIDSIFNLKLNDKTLVVFHSLENYDFYLIM